MLADGETDKALAGATPYLRLFALASGGAYLARGALADRSTPRASRSAASSPRTWSGETGRAARPGHAAAAKALLAAGADPHHRLKDASMTDHILVERHGPVQIIRMNRPDKKNAITRAMYAAMAQALTEGDADPAIRVHVFLGVPGAFSAGNDLADFMAIATGGEGGTRSGISCSRSPARRSRSSPASTASRSASARRSTCTAT